MHETGLSFNLPRALSHPVPLKIVCGRLGCARVARMRVNRSGIVSHGDP